MLTEYQKGYLDGMWAYAWWKDGTCYVGTTGTTYKRAVERFLDDGSTVVYNRSNPTRPTIGGDGERESA